MKKVKMRLEGLDGNAFALMGEFERNGREQRIPQTQLNDVMEKMMDGDYNNLLRVLQDNTVDPDELLNRVRGMVKLSYPESYIITQLYDARGNDYDMKDIKAAVQEVSEEK